MTPPQTIPLLWMSVLAYTDQQPLTNESIGDQIQRMRTDIDAALAANVPDWSVVWGPALNPSRANMMFVAGNRATGEYAVVIRGTDAKYLLNAYQDADVRRLIPYMSFGPTVAARIANGTSEALGVLQGMVGTSAAGEGTLAAWVASIPASAMVYITGHSLGGCLATVVAPWIAALRGADAIGVYTYAAPTAGDAAFASAFNTMFTNGDGSSRAFRFYNTLDAVPNAWETLDTIKTYYDPKPSCPDVLHAAIDCVKKTIGNYAQVGGASNGSAIALPGVLRLATEFGDAEGFLDEVEAQHGGTNYQALLGVQRHSPSLANLTAAVAAASG